MDERGKPCAQCPWLPKNNHLLNSRHKTAAKKGEWFCCHVNLGTCHGAVNYARAATPTPETTE